jgi:3',5'-cyclic AMP phosphodiesterase CpdA
VRRVAHLSDLHFGRIEPGVLDVLRRRLINLEPHLVVVSGDVTQRAKPREFREARAWLDTLPWPRVVVPGNHDVPLYNVLRRFFRPLADYQRFISADLQPCYIDEEIAVVGVNTARSLVFKGGRINQAQVAAVREAICRLDPALTKIVVTHHPFDVPPARGDERQIVGRGRMALQRLADCGADLLLAGHLHASHIGHTSQRYDFAGLSALVIQAGTATSARTRHEPNAFNLLRIASREIEVDRYVLQARDFVRTASEAFQQEGGQWIRR